MWPAIEEMTIPVPPGAITRPNSSSTSGAEQVDGEHGRRGRLDERDAGGVDDLGHVAELGRLFGERVDGLARGDVGALGVTRWPRSSSAAAAAAWLSSLMSAKRRCLPGPWRRAMAWPMPPAPVMTRTSFLVMSVRFRVEVVSVGSVRHDR